jgi:hypothetical protein
VELTPVGVRDAGEIERGITNFARAPNGGLLVAAASSVASYHELLCFARDTPPLARSLSQSSVRHRGWLGFLWH